MDDIQITQFLRDHHKIILGLLAQSEASPSRARSMEAGVEGELLDEIELHCLLEERTLYPALRNCGDSLFEGKIAESFQDHEELRQVVAVAHGFLKELRMLEVREHLETIRSLFEPHVAQEEHELFAFAEKALGIDHRIKLAAKARAIRDEFVKRPSVALRRPRYAQNPNGGEQKRKVI